jgi:hypothetical protein
MYFSYIKIRKLLPLAHLRIWMDGSVNQNFIKLYTPRSLLKKTLLECLLYLVHIMNQIHQILYEYNKN